MTSQYAVSSQNPTLVDLGTGTQVDSFGRPYELFSKACEFDAQPLFYENVLTGSASQSYSTDTTSTTLTAAAAGDVAIRQSRWYVRYRPGKSQQIFVTGNFGGQQTGTVKRMGLFDDDSQPQSTGDGIFFEVDSTGIYVVLRSSASGSSVDTRTAQSNWNGDKLDGSGPSKATLDLTKQQVAVFSYGWLGSSVIQYGFIIEGKPVWCGKSARRTPQEPFKRRAVLFRAREGSTPTAFSGRFRWAARGRQRRQRQWCRSSRSASIPLSSGPI
jgi:hypothetical protein